MLCDEARLPQLVVIDFYFHFFCSRVHSGVGSQRPGLNLGGVEDQSQGVRGRA